VSLGLTVRTYYTIYISKAFDAIPRHLLRNKIYNMSLYNNTKRWLANYLSERHAFVHYNGKSSNILRFPTESPRALFSPLHYLTYTCTISLPAPTHNVQLASYTDDITITATHRKHETAAAQAQQYIYTVEEWLN
jgi:hypothetical protein